MILSAVNVENHCPGACRGGQEAGRQRRLLGGGAVSLVSRALRKGTGPEAALGVGKNQLMSLDVVVGIFWVQVRENAVRVHFSGEGVCWCQHWLQWSSWGVQDLSLPGAGVVLNQNLPAHQIPGGTCLHTKV